MPLVPQMLKIVALFANFNPHNLVRPLARIENIPQRFCDNLNIRTNRVHDGKFKQLQLHLYSTTMLMLFAKMAPMSAAL